MKLGYANKYDIAMANFSLPSSLGQFNKRLKCESQVIICIKRAGQTHMIQCIC